MRATLQPRTSLRAEARALVDSCAGWNSRLAARRITHVLDRALAATGLSTAQVGLMAAIATIADDRLGALAARTGLDQSTLSRNLRTLEGLGLVEIATVERDLRRRAVWLTEAGVRRLAAAIPLWRRAHGSPKMRAAADLAKRLADRAEALALSPGGGEPRRRAGR
jgi:DNA-binding MarR family transcriptional regulator